MGIVSVFLTPVTFFFNVANFLFCLVSGFFSATVEFFSYLWNYKELLLVALALWFVGALYIRYQPEIMEEADFYYRCVIKPWYDDVWRPFWQWIEDIYFILICWWNGAVKISRIFTRIALGILFDCGDGEQHIRVAEALATVFLSAFQAFFEFLFVPPGLLENRLPFEQVAEAIGELAVTLQTYFCCLCQDLCFITDLLASFLSNPDTHCALSGLLNTAVRLLQILLGFFAEVSGFLFAAMALSILPAIILSSFLQNFGMNFLLSLFAILVFVILLATVVVVAIQLLSVYDLDISLRPNFRPAFDEFCTGVECLGASLQDLLVESVDLFVGLTDPDDFPDFFCAAAQLVCATGNAFFVALDFVFNLDTIFWSVLEFVRPILIFFGVPPGGIIDTPASFNPDYVQQIDFDLIYDRIRVPPQVELCAAQGFNGTVDWNGFEDFFNCTEVLQESVQNPVLGNGTQPAFVDCFCEAFDKVDPTQYLSLTQEPLLCCTLERFVKAAVATLKLGTDLFNQAETPERWACFDSEPTCMVPQLREIFRQLYNPLRPADSIDVEEDGFRGLLDCICDLYNQIVLIIGRRIGSAGLDTDDVGNCCYPFMVFYGTVPVLDIPFLQFIPTYDLVVIVLDGIRLFIELIMSTLDFSNYIFCDGPECANYDAIEQRIRSIGRCNCEYLARLNVFEGTFIGDFIDEILACFCLLIVAFYDAIAEILVFVTTLLGNFEDFPLIDLPDLDAFLDTAGAGFESVGCLIGTIFRSFSGEACTAWQDLFRAIYQGLVSTIRIMEAILDNLFSNPGQILPEIITAVLEPFVCFEECPANIPPGDPQCENKPGLIIALGGLLDCYTPGESGESLREVGMAACSIFQNIVRAIFLLFDLFLYLFTGNFSKLAETLREMFFLFLDSFVDFFVEFIPEVFKFIVDLILSIITFGALREVHLQRSTYGWTQSAFLRTTVRAVCEGFEEARDGYVSEAICSIGGAPHTRNSKSAEGEKDQLRIMLKKDHWDQHSTCGKLVHAYVRNDYAWPEHDDFASEHKEEELWACVLARNLGEQLSTRFDMPELGHYVLEREDTVAQATHYMTQVMSELNHLAELGERALHSRNSTGAGETWIPFEREIAEDPSRFVDPGVELGAPSEEFVPKEKTAHSSINAVGGVSVSQRLTMKLHSFVKKYKDPHRASVLQMYKASQAPVHVTVRRLKMHLREIGRAFKGVLTSEKFGRSVGRAAYGVYHYGGAQVRSWMQKEWRKREDVVDHVLREKTEEDIPPPMRNLLKIKNATADEYWERKRRTEHHTRLFDEEVLRQAERKAQYRQDIGGESWWMPRNARALKHQLALKNTMYNLKVRWDGEDPGVEKRHRQEMRDLVQLSAPTVIARANGSREEEERLHDVMERFVFQDPFSPGDDCDCEYVEQLLDQVFFTFRRCWNRTCFGDINITTPLCDEALRPISELIPDPSSDEEWPNFDTRSGDGEPAPERGALEVQEELKKRTREGASDEELRDLFHELQRKYYVFDLNGPEESAAYFFHRGKVRRRSHKRQEKKEGGDWKWSLFLDWFTGVTSYSLDSYGGQDYYLMRKSGVRFDHKVDARLRMSSTRTIQQLVGLTEGVLDFVVEVVRFFFGDEPADDTEQFYEDLLEFIFNSNVNPEAGPVGLAFYIIFPLRCNYELQTTCVRGVGILKGTLYTGIFILAYVIIGATVFPPLLYAFDIIPWLYSLYPLRFQSYPATLMLWLGISFWFSTWCLPALPECLVEEWNLLWDTLTQWDCIQWPPGLLVDPMQAFPPCVDCPERIEFLDCSEIFDSFLATLFYLIAVHFPLLYDFLNESCAIRCFLPFQYLLDLLDLFNQDQYSDGMFPPEFEACFLATFWVHLVPFIFLAVLVAGLLFVLLPRIVSCVQALFVVLNGIFGSLFEDRTVYLVGDVENSSGLTGSDQNNVNSEIAEEAEEIGLQADQAGPSSSRSPRGLRRRKPRARPREPAPEMRIRASRHGAATEAVRGASVAFITSLTDMWHSVAGRQKED